MNPEVVQVAKRNEGEVTLMSGTAVVIDGRNLPAQFIAGAVVAVELRSRGLEPRIVSTGRSHWPWQSAVAQALGIADCFVQAKHTRLGLSAHLRAFFGAIRMAALAYIPQRGLLLVRLIEGSRYRGTPIGDLVFDSHVKSGNIIRPAARPWFVMLHAWRATLTFEETVKVSPGCLTFAYSAYAYASVPGILARRSAQVSDAPSLMYASIPVLSTSSETGKSLRHSARTRFVRENASNPRVQEQAEIALAARLSGRTANKDAKVAYTAPRRVVAATGGQSARHGSADAESRAQASPNVLVAAHSLSDAVHASGHLVFRDYAEWIRRTLRWAKKHRIEAKWIVKEHPYAPIHKEVGLVETLVRRAHMTNVEFVPHSSNTRDLLSAADVVVTARGTIGIEAVALGKPLIVAGATPYSDLDLVQEPTTESEYFGMLRAAIEVGPTAPTEAQQGRAKLALLHEEQSQSLTARLGLDQELVGQFREKRVMRDQIERLCTDSDRLRDIVLNSPYRQELAAVLDEFEKALAHPN